ncbi:MAG: hypothetical protein JXB49_22590 [Bacteroidales bacterium]|nr:hypothetical protein [Bacteroidales bacterium]
MLKINRHNYESFFIDYLDGNLKGKDLSDFKTFLSNNPDLWEELQEFESCQLLVSDEIFPDKRHLKRDINDISKISDDNFEEIVIAYYEKDLDEIHETMLQDYLSHHPEKEKVYSIYSKTFIKPDLTITFNKKSSLKKLSIGQKRNRILYAVASAAAILLLVISIIRQPDIANLLNRDNLATYISQDNVHEQIQISEEKVQEIGSTVNSLSNTTDKADQIIEYKNTIILASGTNVIKSSDTANISNTRNPLYAEKLDSRNINSIECCTKPYEPVFAKQYSLASNYQTDADGGELLLKDIALYEIKTIIYQEEIEQPKKFSFWDVAEASINTFNRFSETDIEVSKKTDANGKLQALAINGIDFGFSTTRIKK